MIINYKNKSLLSIAGTGISLKPGPNTVKASEWATARKHPSIKAMLEGDENNEPALVEESSFEEAEKAGDKEGELEGTHLMKEKQPAAIALVKETIDLELLKKWLAEEKRGPVKKAINDQIKKLEEPAELRDRTESRQVVTGGEPEVVELQAKPNAQDA